MSFKKAVLFADIHYGLKNNSTTHNIDCDNYITWLISESKKFGAETCIFLGDFFHTRNNINVQTFDHAVKSLEKLSAAFEQVILIVGNHDAFYKSNLKVNSVNFANHIKNVRIIDTITLEDDCAFIPWLVEDEWTTIKNVRAKYTFGHFELPNFYTNSKIILQGDHSKLKCDDFSGSEYIFSGHFHIRQTYKNCNGSDIIYIGNAFPHNFGDVDDIERGCVLLEHGVEPKFINWEDCPRYHTCLLTEILEQPEKYLSNKTHVRSESDININYSDIAFIRETLVSQFNCRELIISQKKIEDNFQDMEDSNDEFKTVDAIVLDHINSLESATFDKSVLTDIYNAL